MYTGNIKPWTLSFMFYLFVLILSHQVESTHSIPALSRRVDQRTNNMNALEDYLNALSLNGTNTPRSRYFVNRSPSALNKRSYRRLGRAGSYSGSRINNAFMAKIEDERARVQCQPRDRVVDSYEELGIPRGYGDFLLPECIVVRRCKQGGCCGDDQECVPSRTTNVTMNFLQVRQQIPIEIVHETVHDLECECQDKPSFCPEPVVDCPDDKVWSYSECTCKCRNRCPKPFLQDEDTCGCDCLSQDRHCKNIYKGRRNGKLSQEECDCVRKGLCGKPPCINGAFSISDCKCINSNS
uniref:Vascular endothelial growth factor n=1 Tax=Lytechinus pictus TaxID=7653 RepID=K4FF94_LYTPI|nr:vascular endothelial growth factor precursor [Lytechinus pictus]